MPAPNEPANKSSAIIDWPGDPSNRARAHAYPLSACCRVASVRAVASRLTWHDMRYAIFGLVIVDDESPSGVASGQRIRASDGLVQRRGAPSVPHKSVPIFIINIGPSNCVPKHINPRAHSLVLPTRTAQVFSGIRSISIYILPSFAVSIRATLRVR